MIGKKFEGVDNSQELVFGDDRECFNKHSVKTITDRYKGKSLFHFFIGRPIEVGNSRRVCPIYDCSGNGKDKLEHEDFAEIALGSTDQMRAIRDEITKDHKKMMEEIEKIGGDFDDERVADELLFSNESAMHALGWIRVFQFMQYDGSVECVIDLPCDRYYKMKAEPEQFDTLMALLNRGVIRDEEAIDLAEDRCRQKERDFDALIKKIRAKHSEDISEV